MTDNTIVESRTIGVGTLKSTIRTGEHPDVSVELHTPFGPTFLVTEKLVMPLTDCCGATATGLDDYVGCRRCYSEIPSSFGDCSNITDPADTTRMVRSILSEYENVPDFEATSTNITKALQAEWERQNATLVGR